MYSRGQALDAAKRHGDAIQKLANVKLEFHSGAAPKAGTMRSTAEFDLVLEVPESQAEAKRERATAKSGSSWRRISPALTRQLGDGVFL